MNVLRTICCIHFFACAMLLAAMWKCWVVLCLSNIPVRPDSIYLLIFIKQQPACKQLADRSWHIRKKSGWIRVSSSSSFSAPVTTCEINHC